MIVLDASALLAYLFRENGHAFVAQHIDDACISSVNLSEVLGRFIRDGVDTKPLIQQLEQTSIEVVPFTQEHALFAARLIPHTKSYGLSLGDRACLGLAVSRKCPAMTADTTWTEIDGLDFDIVVIRE